MNNLDTIRLVEEKLKEVMSILEIQPTPSNEGTPHRVAKMWVNELFKNRDRDLTELRKSMKTFDNPDLGNEALVIVKGIKFHSVCEHHWLPFSGTVDVGYLPSDKVIGLSKIPRTVKYFSQMPQLQEQLGADICNFLYEEIGAKAVFVRVVATHGCVMCRGVESECETDTISMLFRPEMKVDGRQLLINDFRGRVK